jgi:hypothetical protein
MTAQRADLHAGGRRGLCRGAGARCRCQTQVMQRQRTVLADRYDLSDRPATGVMMSGGRKAVSRGSG